MYACTTVRMFGQIPQIRMLENCRPFETLLAESSAVRKNMTPLLKSLSWLPVKDQLYYRQTIMTFKCTTGQAPEYLTLQFITREQVSERKTRSSQKLNIPLFRPASGQRTFHYRTVKLGNNLESFLK